MIGASQSHPLEIAAVDIEAGLGRIGLTLAPGRREETSDGDAWARDLGADLDAIVAWGGRRLLTLIEPRELEELDIAGLGAEARRRGLEWLHLPIPDLGAPGPVFASKWARVSIHLRARLGVGESLVIHGRDGRGRPGMIAARLLADAGLDPETAIARVRAAQPGSLEIPAQERWARSGRA
jgi:protein-tyrosine phosphatase